MSDDTTPNYMKDQKAKKQESVEKAAEDIERDRMKFDSAQRFGFFTIPYPAVCNDKAYSRDKDFSKHKIIDGKVVTEPRGIYTQPLKKGRGKEAYFSVEKPWSDAEIAAEKQYRLEEKKKQFEKVDKIRKNEVKGPSFKDAGPQEITGFYKVAAPAAKGTLYKEEDKLRHIGPDRQIIIEKRGIYVNPPKVSTSFNPKDFFSFYFTPKNVVDRMVKGREDDEAKKLEKVKLTREKKIQYRIPFKPASLKKNECFANNVQTFGGMSDSEFKSKVDEYKENKKNGNKKFEKKIDPSFVQHSMPFRLARLKYSGRDGLFNDDLYKIPTLPPEHKISLQERLAYEEQHKKEPFKSCRLMQTSHFAPCISSFTTNLKKDFPTISFN